MEIFILSSDVQCICTYLDLSENQKRLSSSELYFTSMDGKATKNVSSSFSREWIYDLFLSFRADDTQKNFTDHLFYALKDAGVNTFRDDDKLHRREDIVSELVQAIKTSRISLVVLSRNYAASRQCLQELVCIMECRRTLQQKVLPIFYDVDPSDVRKQMGTFAQAFARHEEVFPVDKVALWREALTEVANLSGWDLRNVADGHEAKFIRKIVEEITRELNQTNLFVAMYPVGLDLPLQIINSLLKIESNDVRMVGICGIGGVGKTTLAKAAFNQHFHYFEGKSFIADVREKFKHPNGRVLLQEQLLSDILKEGKIKLTTVDRGVNAIKEKLCNRKVLVVLDDVDHLDQLNALARKRDCFGLGSRIIITTRDEHLLKQIEVDAVFRAIELNDAESLELFSWHAFRKAYPNDDYVELSKGIVAYSERLPLALTVLGSLLFKRGISEWESALEKLKRIPHEDVQKKLRISFDALSDDEEKDIFLDIACFFIGADKDYVIKILDSCDLRTESGITVLMSRCLVSINIKNKLVMHDLVRDMGREIVREESLKNPGKRSRLWHYEDVIGVLRSHMGTEAVGGLLLNVPQLSEVHLSAEAFGKMNKLRLLKLNYVHVTGVYAQISKELRLLCWHNFPLRHIPSDFHMENLVALDMRHSNLRQVWHGRKFLGKLKILKLSHSPYLTRTPDFKNLPNLEKLILKDCTSLVELHQSIGHLQRLIMVNVKDCGSLENLPGSICKIKSLEILNLSGCTKIVKLPEDIGEIESLRELITDGTMIREVPFSIVSLKNLQTLSLHGCKGTSSSSFIFSWMSIRSPKCTNLLPASVAGLSSLTTLSLRSCNLSDDAIPKDIGKLSSLTNLDLGCNNFQYLSNSISSLPKLKALHVDNCSKLQSLPELPSTLLSLVASDCASLERISNLSNFKRLPILSLTNCQNLVDIPGLENLNIARSLVYMAGCNNLSGILRESILRGWSQSSESSVNFPGSEIPSWFSYQAVGSSLSFQVPPNSNGKNLLKWLTICVVYGFKGFIGYPLYFVPSIKIANKTKGLHLDRRRLPSVVPSILQDHICARHLPSDVFGTQWDEGDEVAVVVDGGDELNVKKCGVNLVFDGTEMGQHNLAFRGPNQCSGLNVKRMHLSDDDDDEGPSSRQFDGDGLRKRMRHEHDSGMNVDEE